MGYKEDMSNTTSQQPPQGQRVVFWRDQECFPHFTVPAGTTGTVVESTEHGVAVHVDQHVPGLSDSEEWTGDYWWSRDDQLMDPCAPFAALITVVR